jgi:hypothetical protein
MNTKEIYVLNRVLDGEDLKFLPSFANLKMSELTISAVKDGLINRGWLKSYSEFSEEGFRLTDCIRRYKEAKKHIKLDNLCIGLNDDEDTVCIIYNPLFDEYAFDVFDGSMGADQIAESYTFISEQSGADEHRQEKLEYAVLAGMFRLDSENSFRLRSSSEETESEEVYFWSDGQLYIYDFIESTLYASSKQSILSSLNERMKA